MNEEAHQWREELGAYLVGALDAEETERMRAHLEECAECRAEYAELAPVAELLAKVPAEAFIESRDSSADVAPDPAMWERLRARAGLADAAESPSEAVLRANPTLPGGQRPGGSVRPPQPTPSSRPAPPRRSARRSMRPSTAAVISAALVAAAAIGIYAGTRPAPTTAPESSGAETVSAVNAVDGVSGTVQYRPTNWGSWVQITLKGVKPGDDCVLYAMDRNGNRAVASSWWAPTLISESATIPGGVSMEAWNIKTFQVTTSAGEVLLTVPTA